MRDRRLDEAPPEAAPPSSSSPDAATRGLRREATLRSAFDLAVATDVGLVRVTNEDCVLTQRFRRGDTAYIGLIVADGVGGEPRGREASRLAAAAAMERLVTGDWVRPHEALADAASAANRSVRGLATGPWERPASTLVIALVQEDEGRLYVANVGDSRAYVIKASRADPVTVDHMTGVRLAVEEADNVREVFRTVLTRAVGMEEGVQPDLFGPFSLRPGEAVLLCTDGLHRVLDDVTIGRVVADRPAAQVVALLVAAANAEGGRDNVAVAFARRHG